MVLASMHPGHWIPAFAGMTECLRTPPELERHIFAKPPSLMDASPQLGDAAQLTGPMTPA